MKNAFLLLPSGQDVGLTAATLGLAQAMKNQNINIGFVKPITQDRNADGSDSSINLLKKIHGLEIPDPIPLSRAESLLSTGNSQELMEEVFEMFSAVAEHSDIVIVEGMVASSNLFYAKRLNNLMIVALDADTILVATPWDKTPEQLLENIEIEAGEYMESTNTNISGVFINKIGLTPEIASTGNLIRHTKIQHFSSNTESNCNVEKMIHSYTDVLSKKFNIVSATPWLTDLISPTLNDLADYLNAHGLRKGKSKTRRINSITLCAMSLHKSFYYFQDGALILTSADRPDILLAASLATINGIKLAGVLICGRFEPEPNALIMCEQAFAKGLSLFSTSADIYNVAAELSRYRKEISLNDEVRAKEVINTMSSYVNVNWITQKTTTTKEHRVTPAEFRNQLIKMARNNIKRIVLPEGEEPRTVRAAIICSARGIATPILLGNPTKIHKVAESIGLTIPPEIEIIEPKTIADNYVDELVEIRKSKGLTKKEAKSLLNSEIYLGTMMLKKGEVDGLVAGAIQSTADTVRPALQIIKTAPQSKLISSIFFMCLPTQVLIYGDCAINQDPNAEELAEIGIQSVQSAEDFHIPQRVAMISYSTGFSGKGEDVEKVRQATEIIKESHPDLEIDGPMQYDAATTPSVALTKAPNSKIAGNATILIFPDLNTGNTTYKAVQRSGNLVSIGPMLQGLAKPVNDLSRGASTKDIIYTIALTAIQAQRLEESNKVNNNIKITEYIDNAIDTDKKNGDKKVKLKKK